MNRTCRFVAGLIVVTLIAGLPIGYSAYCNANLRNVRVVKSGVLYRSGQLSGAGLERLIHDHGIRTVVSLRDAEFPGAQAPDESEAELCEGLDIRHVRITPRSWWPDKDGNAPAEQGIQTFLDVMDDPSNYPVLVHCFAGVHRTGAMIAVYRMEKDRWTNSEALAELRQNGYVNLDREKDVLGFLENYRPRWRSAK